MDRKLQGGPGYKSTNKPGGSRLPPRGEGAQKYPEGQHKLESDTFTREELGGTPDPGKGQPTQKSLTAKEEIQQNTNFIITKFMKKGFDSLTEEDLACTMIAPDFNAKFRVQTGTDWDAEYQVKVLERLKRTNFDIHWMQRNTSDSKYSSFFMMCKMGDIDKVCQTIRTAGDDIIHAVDTHKCSGLHIAARNGHTAVVDVLINNGFNTNARDRFLRTPLHLACLGGHETIANVLISNKADIRAKDSLGTTCLHQGCCSSSIQLINLLISSDPELIHLEDNHGRTPLHYVVWNQSKSQIDIGRLLISQGAEVDSLDNESRTPLHHASEGGRINFLPVLLQFGANIGLRDGLRHKTALELACSDRVKDQIIVYSGAPHKTNMQDLAFLNQAVEGQNVRIEEVAEGYKSKKDRMTVKKATRSRTQGNKNVGMEEDEEGPIPFNIKYYKDTLIQLLRRVQEYGAQSYEHVKKPYLFSGSWMEGVNTLDDLMLKLDHISTTESVMRVFNICYPYNKPLPRGLGDELAISSFYGETTKSPIKDETKSKSVSHAGTEKPEFEPNEVQQQTIKDLKNVVNLTNIKLEAKEREVESLKRDLLEKTEECDKLELEISQYEGMKKDTYMVEELQRQIKRLNIEINKGNASNETQRDILMESQKKVAMLERQIEREPAKIEKLNMKIEQLEKIVHNQQDKEVEYRMEAEKLNKSLKAARTQGARQPPESREAREIRTAGGGGRWFAGGGESGEYGESGGEDPHVPSSKKVREIKREAQGRTTPRDNIPQNIPRPSKKTSLVSDICPHYQGPICGELKMQIHQVQGLRAIENPKTMLIYAVVSVPAYGKSLKTALRDYAPNIQLGDARRVVFKEQECNKISGIFKIELWATDKQTEKAQVFLGETSVPWGTALESPNTWLISNKSFQLVDPEQKAGYELVKGTVGISCKFIEWGFQPESKFQKDGTPITKAIESKDVAGVSSKIRDVKLIHENLKVYKGKLIVMAICARELKIGDVSDKTSDPRCVVSFMGQNQETDEKANTLNPNWKKILEFAVDIKTEEELPKLDVLIQDEDFIGATFLGSIKIDLTPCFTEVCTWAINNKFILTDPDEKAKKEKESPVSGFIYLGIKFVDESHEDKSGILKYINEYTQIDGKDVPGVFSGNKGVLRLNIICARGIRAADSGTNSDAYCVVKLDAKKKAETKPITSLNPNWKYKRELPILLEDKDPIPKMLFQLFDSDTLATDDYLGEVELDIEPCFITPKEWVINKMFPITDLNKKSKKQCTGQLYLQLKYIPESVIDNELVGPLLEEVKESMKSAENIVEGKIKMQIVNGRGLRKADNSSSDPYVVVKVKGKDMFETKSISTNINPNWDCKKEFQISYDKSKETAPEILFEVLDSDGFAKDDFLGEFKVSMKELCVHPNEWIIDFGIALEDPKNRAPIKSPVKGTIYLQCKFIPEGELDNNQYPSPKLEFTQVLEDTDIPRINGKLFVNVVSGNNLPKKSKTDLPSPYVKMLIQGKKRLETIKCEKSICPTWNKLECVNIDFPGDVAIPKIQFIVMDSVWGSDDYLGEVSVNLSSLITNKNEWFINSDLPLSDPQGKLKKIAMHGSCIYIQSKFQEEGVPDDGVIPDVVKAENIPQYEPIVGKLKVNIINCRDLRRVEAGGVKCYAEATLTGGKLINKTRNSEKTLNPTWRKMGEQELSLDPDKITPELKVVVKGDVFGSDAYLGEVRFNLDKIVENKNKWFINDARPLQDLAKSGKPISGTIYLQIEFVEKAMENTSRKAKIRPELMEITGLVDDNKIRGVLKFNVVNARNLRSADKGISDSFCVLRMSNKEVAKSTIIKDLNPNWELTKNFDIDIQPNEMPIIHIEVKDKDKFGDDFLGECEIKMDTVINNPNKWTINDPIPLLNPQNRSTDNPVTGTLYIQSKFVGEFDEDDGQLPAENKAATQFSTNIEVKLIKGKLNVNVIKGVSLMKEDGDSADPYVIVKLRDKTYECKYIEKNINPEWNYKMFAEINCNETTIPPMQIVIMDHDAFGDDFMGQADLDLREIIKKKNEWGVNNWYMLKDIKGHGKRKQPVSGSIYVQCQYVEEGTPADQVQAPPVTDLPTPQTLVTIFKGNLKTKFVRANGICATEDNNTSDGYAKLLIKKKEVCETKPVKGTLDPIWNEEKTTPLILDKNNPPELSLELWDYNRINDKFLGMFEVNALQLLENKNKVGINHEFELCDPNSRAAKGKLIRGTLYIQMAFIVTGQPDVTFPEPSPHNAQGTKQIEEKRPSTTTGKEEIKESKKETKEKQVPPKTAPEKAGKAKAEDKKNKDIEEVLDDNEEDALIDESLEEEEKVPVEEPPKEKPGKVSPEEKKVKEAEEATQKKVDKVEEVKKPTGPYIGTLRVKVVKANNLRIGDDKSSDSYASVLYNGKEKFKTKTNKKDLNPIWDKIGDIPIDIKGDQGPELLIECKDSDWGGDDFLGETIIDYRNALQNAKVWSINQAYDLKPSTKGKKIPKDKTITGNVHIQICFIPKEVDVKTIPAPPAL